MIVDGRLAPANLADQAVAAALLALDGAAGVRARGWVVADRAYGSTRLAEDLAVGGGWLLAPPRGIARIRRRPPPWVVGKRRRVETVIGQLVARYHLKRVWARDAWHLWSRWLRKLLKPHHGGAAVPTAGTIAAAIRAPRLRLTKPAHRVS